MNRACRVCGFDNGFHPWGEDGKTASYEICDCCGVEFGYEDSNVESVKLYRQSWVEKGAPWFNEKLKPKDWSFEKQLNNIDKKYF